MMQQLATLNLVNQWRLLCWLLIMPNKLDTYNNQFGENTLKQTGSWLISTLTWLPLLIPVLALTLNWSVNTNALFSLLFLAAVLVPWLIGAWFGHLSSRWAMAAMFIVNACASTLLLFQITLLLAFDYSGKMGSVVLFVTAFAISFGVAFGVAYALKIGLSGIIPVMLAAFATFSLFLGLQFGMFYGIVFAVVAALTPTLSALRTASRLRGMIVFIALIASWLALIWLYFFDGWQAFPIG